MNVEKLKELEERFRQIAEYREPGRTFQQEDSRRLSQLIVQVIEAITETSRPRNDLGEQA
jgi:hypothetical protein